MRSGNALTGSKEKELITSGHQPCLIGIILVGEKKKKWTNPDSNRRPPAFSAMLSGCDNQLHHMPYKKSMCKLSVSRVDVRIRRNQSALKYAQPPA